MQIFVEKRSGGRLLVDVEASDTIGSVKAQIQEVYGIPPDKQRLFYDEDLQGELEDGRILSDCEIQNEEDVLVLKVPMQIFATTLGGGSITVHVDAFDTIDNVKLHIQDQEGILPGEQRLIFGTTVLSVGPWTLNAYGIRDEALLSLVRCHCWREDQSRGSISPHICLLGVMFCTPRLCLPDAAMLPASYMTSQYVEVSRLREVCRSLREV
ncbi:MAG: hypothetical protein MK077_10510 [Phycisphaerales bacterium]|nr:hypothetical protein [Phycisphaerales bacterium]